MTKQNRTRQLLTLATLLVLNLTVVPPAPAKDRASASVALIARVLPLLRLEAGQPEVTGAPGTARAYGSGVNTIVVTTTAVGDGSNPTVVSVPLSLRANVRSFILRANIQGASRGGNIYLDSHQPEEAFLSRPFPFRENLVFAMGSAQGTPLSTTLKISFDPIPAGQTETFRITIAMETQGY